MDVGLSRGQSTGRLATTNAVARIAGSTRLFGVVGNPIRQVMAPALMNALFDHRGVDAVLVPLLVEPSNLSSAFAGLKRLGNFDGLLVTVPHKFAAIDLADDLGESARMAGSVNALRREADGRWSGDNFDGAGFVRGLLAADRPLEGRRVSLAGAGGAGVAIAAALLASGVERLSVTDVDQSRMTALADRLNARWPRLVSVSGEFDETCDLAVNATPLGLRDTDPLPFRVDRFKPDTLVADIIMNPAETRLLKAAAARGLPVHPGLPMLTEQVELYRQFFRIA